jgi:hypothetical protein
VHRRRSATTVAPRQPCLLAEQLGAGGQEAAGLIGVVDERRLAALSGGCDGRIDDQVAVTGEPAGGR